MTAICCKCSLPGVMSWDISMHYCVSLNNDNKSTFIFNKNFSFAFAHLTTFACLSLKITSLCKRFVLQAIFYIITLAVRWCFMTTVVWYIFGVLCFLPLNLSPYRAIQHPYMTAAEELYCATVLMRSFKW